jgi:carbamoyltransferase
MSKKAVFILGIACFGQHDSAAALIRDGMVIAAAEEERFSRIKHDRSFPMNAISYCLQEAGISIKDIDHAAFFWKPWKGVLRRLWYMLRSFPASLGNGQRNGRVLYDLSTIERVFKNRTGYTGKFHFVDHHIAHAASTFFSSGMVESAILSVDGTGESETCWIGRASDSRIEQCHGVKWPHSLGHVYSAFTQFLGFKMFGDEYKVMGLSSFGVPVYLPLLREIIKSTPKGLFEIDLTYMSYQRGTKLAYSKKLVEKLGSDRKPDDPITDRHKNIAASLQTRIEEILLELSKTAIRDAKKSSLCLSGGVALNSVAVGKLAESGIAKLLYTSPVSGDSGCALGAALYLDRIVSHSSKRQPLLNAYLGPSYSDSDIERVLKAKKLPYERTSDPAKIGAKMIERGNVIGWFQGRSEVGERALGNRSILADPRDPATKDRINLKIKNREPFRPFAPAILEEYQPEYFDWKGAVPYMTEVHSVKKEKRAGVPAVVHIDGTGRLQTVSTRTNPLFRALIKEFHALTGVPLVLNTSFNMKDEPIVNSPENAIETFLRSNLDLLIIGNFIVASAKTRSAV